MVCGPPCAASWSTTTSSPPPGIQLPGANLGKPNPGLVFLASSAIIHGFEKSACPALSKLFDFCGHFEVARLRAPFPSPPFSPPHHGRPARVFSDFQNLGGRPLAKDRLSPSAEQNFIKSLPVMRFVFSAAAWQTWLGLEGKGNGLNGFGIPRFSFARQPDWRPQNTGPNGGLNRFPRIFPIRKPPFFFSFAPDSPVLPPRTKASKYRRPVHPRTLLRQHRAVFRA